jgi:cation:H+ antiporter
MPDILVLNLVFFVLGLAIIIRGSDLFLDNAVWIARSYGISQIVIGATLVSFCTTLPEVVSSVTASLKGSGDMAIGNAVGSVICNTGLIMGFMLVMITAKIRREVFLVKGVFMLGSLVMLLCLSPGLTPGRLAIDRMEGLVLLVLLVIFVVVNYYESIHNFETREDGSSAGGARPNAGELGRHLMFFLLGAACVTLGAWLLVEFGQKLARNLGVSEAVISLLFIALGTSLPELFTAISAVRKKAEQVSVGNIFGANVLNSALVVGASATIRPLEPRDAYLMSVDIPMALLLGATAFLFGLVRGRMGRRIGLALLGLYGFYIVSMLLLGRL